MACSACQQARQRAAQAARSYSLGGLASAVSDAVAINIDKLRGMSTDEVNAKYGAQPSSTAKPATPYVRTR